MYKSLIYILVVILALPSKAAIQFAYELIGITSTATSARPIISLPPPILLTDYIDTEQKKDSEIFAQEASRYNHGHYPRKGCLPNPKERLLNLYKAACLGYPSACSMLAEIYRSGEYGLGPDEAIAKMYEANMQWWERPRAQVPAASALPAVEERSEVATATDSESGSRRSSGDSDKSSDASAGAGEPASGLRHRGGAGKDA